MLVMALASLSQTAIPLLLGALVDEVRRGLSTPDASWNAGRVTAFYLGAMGVAYLVRECLQTLRRLMVENTCARIEKDLLVQLISRILRADFALLTRERIGTLHGRIHRGIGGLVRLLKLAFLDFFPTIFVGAFAILAATIKAPWIGCFMALIVPVATFIVVRQVISQNGVRRELKRSVEMMDGMIVEQLGGLDHIRASNTHDGETKRVAGAAEERRIREVRHHTAMSLFGSARALNEAFFHLLVLGFAVYLAVQGKISVGDLLAFPMLFLGVMSPLNEIHRAIDEGHELSLSVGDLLDLMEMPIDCSFRPEEPRKPLLVGSSPAIVSQDLRVVYSGNGNGGKEALAGASATIRHGEMVGIAGRSGSGKSTWLRVLMRLTHPTDGAAYLGGVPLTAVSRDDLEEIVAYVGQSPFVFKGTIGDNIAYGTQSASRDDIQEAARMACIHDEILTVLGGYDSQVAEAGKNLSGGQKQRLALARAFLRATPILFLDEGTSALDNISERHIHDALATGRTGRTILLVAHRLTTLLHTDRILVFDKGRVVETGTYSELLRRDGVFTHLVRSAERNDGAL
jgi:ATP-binding cassette subfamily B protein